VFGLVSCVECVSLIGGEEGEEVGWGLFGMEGKGNLYGRDVTFWRGFDLIGILLVCECSFLHYRKGIYVCALLLYHDLSLAAYESFVLCTAFPLNPHDTERSYSYPANNIHPYFQN
jgi:hypothetical protein